MPRKWMLGDRFYGEYQTILFSRPADAPVRYLCVNSNRLTISGKVLTVRVVYV